MPRYYYECQDCNEISLYMLSMSEEPKECIICESTGSLLKDCSKNAFIMPNKQKTKNKQRAGTITKEYIEENKKILEQQKNEFKAKEYE